MRMLMRVNIPNKELNSAVADGTVGRKISQILEDIRPETVYFTEEDGCRGAMMVVEVSEPSKIPALAEPWFLHFNADCEFRIAMSPNF